MHKVQQVDKEHKVHKEVVVHKVQWEFQELLEHKVVVVLQDFKELLDHKVHKAPAFLALKVHKVFRV